MPAKKALQAPTDTSFVGQFFHSIGKDGQVEWQGHVLGNPEPGWYLVQLFEWLMGEPNVRRLVKMADMELWLFYESAESMKFSYEYGVAREGGKYRKRPTDNAAALKNLTIAERAKLREFAGIHEPAHRT